MEDGVSGRLSRVLTRMASDLSPLTTGKFGKKESTRLPAQNRRMLGAMETTVHTACERLQLTLVVALLLACLANLALVWAWL
jgi:hypothetical protein